MSRLKNILIRIQIFGIIFLSCGVVEKLANRPPVITQLFAIRTMLSPNDTTTVAVVAEDPDENALSYTWSAEAGTFSSTQGQSVLWTSPSGAGRYTLSVTVRDENDAKVSDQLTISVVSEEKPVVEILEPKNHSFLPGTGDTTIIAFAKHPNMIGRVEFYVDGTLLGVDERELFSGIYKQVWSLQGLSGTKTLTVIAYRLGSDTIKAEHSILVNVEGVSPVPF